MTLALAMQHLGDVKRDWCLLEDGCQVPVAGVGPSMALMLLSSWLVAALPGVAAADMTGMVQAGYPRDVVEI